MSKEFTVTSTLAQSDKVAIRIEQAHHECGQIIEQIIHLTPDPDFSLILSSDDIVMNSVPTGTFSPPELPRHKLTLTGYYERVEINGIELRDHALRCQKCGIDILLPSDLQPTPKHNGNLDGPIACEARIECDPSYKGCISISGGYGLIESTDITIDAKQALSLLVWLRENESTLEKLAKEQAG